MYSLLEYNASIQLFPQKSNAIDYFFLYVIIPEKQRIFCLFLKKQAFLCFQQIVEVR